METANACKASLPTVFGNSQNGGNVQNGHKRRRSQKATRADQNRFIDCPVRFQANRLKNVFPSEWHREHQIVYVKADLLKVAGRVSGGAAV